ncbi:MAG TPA: heavy metal translocating P-type ATPase, partial [Chitinophagales bacterium]|nr:heavy metal translocating P-type ATPase [Chitinophagales bacterium]
MLSTPVLVWFGKDFFINAWKQAQHRSTNMDTLVALSTGIAYIFSVFNMLYPSFWESRGLEAHVYFEAAAVIIAFILLGRLLEEKAKGNTSTAIKKLMGLQPKTLTIIDENNLEKEIKIEDIELDHIIVVKPGDKIAVDGVVTQGNSYVDESMLSGEPIPVLKEKGEEVFAGTINQKGSFRFKATKVGKDTMLANIIQMIQEAQGSKAPVQQLVDKIASVFVPTIIVIAIITFISWWFFGGENGLEHALLSAVTVLIIACPCALGLATPTAIMVGIGKGAENGILIKDAESLELSTIINTIVLDKTGTITEGAPKVNDVIWLENTDVLRSILVSLERLSEHPLAHAVVSHFKDVQSVELESFVNIVGQGVQANYNKKTYYIGSPKLLRENNISVDPKLQKKADDWNKKAHTVVWFTDEHQALAALAISDKIKETSIDAIKRLKEMG